MKHWAVAAGWAEQRVLRLLLARGWLLVARNWRCRWGELDLVLTKPQRLLVVEVKGRSSAGPDGGGWAALRLRKRQRLRRSIACWLAAHPQYGCFELQLVAALVWLPPRRGAVRWCSLSDWG
ncbi:MAG: YraN family protein [Prochlorococcaceae cyanobacterium]|jgi:putative endonuclease